MSETDNGVLERFEEVADMAVTQGAGVIPRREGDRIAFYYNYGKIIALPAYLMIVFLFFLLIFAYLSSGFGVFFGVAVWLFAGTCINSYRNRGKDVIAPYFIDLKLQTIKPRFVRQASPRIEQIECFVCLTRMTGGDVGHDLTARLSDGSEITIESGTLDDMRDLARLFGFLCDKPAFACDNNAFRPVKTPLESIKAVEKAELKSTLLRPSTGAEEASKTLLRPAKGAETEDAASLLRPIEQDEESGGVSP